MFHLASQSRKIITHKNFDWEVHKRNDLNKHYCCKLIYTLHVSNCIPLRQGATIIILNDDLLKHMKPPTKQYVLPRLVQELNCMIRYMDGIELIDGID